MSWTVIVPVKRLEFAKTRLRGALADADHDALVLAMALDTVSAAMSSPVVGRVVVVTGDHAAADAARGLGADVIVDVPDAGLNPALAYAATNARPRGASASLPGVAALSADLPALRTGDLTDALRRAEEFAAAWVAASASGGAQVALPDPSRVFVADSAGTGTVLLAAAPGAPLEPCFGPGSAAAHLASGAVELTGEWPSLRRDVDTAEDLAEAMTLGLGPRTGAIAADIGGLRDPVGFGETREDGIGGPPITSIDRRG